MDFLIVTGLSGSGKSQVIHALEDMGFYCVDNIPPELLDQYFKLCSTTPNGDKYAAVVDSRAFRLFGSISELKRRVEGVLTTPKLLYLEASNEVLVRRFKETRRRHPLLDDGSSLSLPQAVDAERALLTGARAAADFLVDTSALSPTQLKERISTLFSVERHAMVVSVYSFGFKHGLPSDADLVFDVRCLPNPHYIEALCPYTGMDKPVYDYVFGFDAAVGMYSRLLDLVSYALPLYRAEGKSRLVISIGCTGGHHRSVAFAQRLTNDLAQDHQTITLTHRDIGR